MRNDVPWGRHTELVREVIRTTRAPLDGDNNVVAGNIWVICALVRGVTLAPFLSCTCFAMVVTT
jgi:hypothetical protein